MLVAARLIVAGIPERRAREVAIAAPLSDVPALMATMQALIAGSFA